MRGRPRVPVSPAALLICLAALFGLVYEAGGTGSAPPARGHAAAAVAQRPMIIAATAAAEHAPMTRGESGAVFLVNHTQASCASVDRPGSACPAPYVAPPVNDPAAPPRRARPPLPPDTEAPPDRVPAHDRPARAPPSDTGF